jgi:hypothetical protein
MENVTIENDINVFYLTASSFPDGIQEVHARLHSLVEDSSERTTFGISRPENGTIIYRVGFEEKYAGDGAIYDCATFVLKKGTYSCISVMDFMKDPASIKNAFTTLLSQLNLDGEGYCVERYKNERDVDCMIRMAD